MMYNWVSKIKYKREKGKDIKKEPIIDTRKLKHKRRERNSKNERKENREDI